ncbi:MAG TPA: hypothetical protein VKA07_15490 [Candidatus Sulfotelmatobacter sp.]|nr:hypothetical protein [Candidatus Sulfotelmatobacter sp.]
MNPTLTPERDRVGTAALGCPVERSSTAVSLTRQLPGFARPDSRGRLSLHGLCLALLLLLSTFASAQTLTGTVKNSTTGKPAGGDEVVLLSLSQGMQEADRSKTDAKGKFSLKLDNAQGPHLVRVIHEGVTYHRMAPPGTTSVEIEVYDAGKTVDGIEVVADVMRIQVEKGQLEVMRQFAVQNTSKPPRTQMNERNLEFYIPEGAQLMGASAMTEGGNPINSAPVPEDDKKTRYAFLFPLRPGTTQFEVAYQLPYTGSANIDPRSIYPLQHFVAMLPKSIQFAPAPGTNYQNTPYPKEPDADVEVASNATVGQTLAFKISGEGVLQGETGGEEGGGGQGSAEAENRPGGGLGPPIDAPNPLRKYQLPLLIGLGAVLGLGGVIVAWRQQSAGRSPQPAAAGEEEVYEPVAATVGQARPVPSRSGAQPAVAPRSSTSMLLEGLKEEIFQLEVEHKQGRISQEEYEKTKAALDQTLQRALKREASARQV